MSSITQGNTSVFLEHAGPGDNIAGNKVINEYRKLAPESLHKTIDQILSDCRERKTDTAKVRIETIKSTGSLDINSETIINMLSVRLNIIDDVEKTKIYSSLILFLNQSTDPLPRDLCSATLIRLDAENNRISDARERYLQINQPFTYSEETFYELVANYDELKEAYEQKRISLGESELNGLVRGSFRTDKLDLALKITNRLNSIYPSFNSKVLLLTAKASMLFNRKMQGKSFWTLTLTLKTELIAIIQEVNSLIDESAGKDSRLFDIAAPCIQFTLGYDKKLTELCWKYVDEIEKKHPEVAAELHNINAKDPSKIEDTFLLNHAKAQHDEKYRSQIVQDIISKKSISSSDFVILRIFSSKKELSRWLHSGGIIYGQEDLEADFTNIQTSLILLSTAQNKIKTNTDGIRINLENFIKTYQDNLEKFNPYILIELTKSLLEHPELSPLVCDLIKPILPTSDYWLSPIVECYIEALLMSQQLVTLATVLTEIKTTEWDGFVWNAQAALFEQQGDYINAIESIEKALIIDSNSLFEWHTLIRLYRKSKESNKRILSVFNRIPDSVLEKEHQLATPLLFEMAMCGNFIRAEKLILSWFINAPDTCAIIMSDFHFNFITNNQDISPSADNIGHCIFGVRYKKDNLIFTKLLVDLDPINHHCLINIHSPIGEILLTMDLNEIKQQGMHSIELLERIPPYVAAFQISLELRQIQNDGSDPFNAFTLPENPDEIGDFFKQMLYSNNEGKNNIIENPDIPFIFKGHYFHPNNPVKAALEQISTPNSKKSFLNSGEGSISEAVLDVYAIAYLAMTGLAFGLTDSPITFVISEETKYAINQWLEDININRLGYLGITGDGRLSLQTAEDFEQSTKHIQEALHLIISKTKIVTPSLVDMPPILLGFQKFIDNSVYSSIKLSISNDIPWLGMDASFSQLFITSDWKIANPVTLFNELGNNLTFEQKKHGLYLYAMGNIPYTLTFQDLNLLTISNDEHAHYYLAKILLIHPDAFTKTTIAVEFLSGMFSSVLAKACLDKTIFKGLRINNPTHNGYAEMVFYACCHSMMQCNDGIKPELAFSMFICKLIGLFKPSQKMINLTFEMATEFATGNFLCIPTINDHIEELMNKNHYQAYPPSAIRER